MALVKRIAQIRYYGDGDTKNYPSDVAYRKLVSGSIFSDKLGKTICNPLINVVDDGTIPYNRGSINFDDEGIEGQKTYIVTEGRLTSYLHDRISARHYGVKPTGNGRRESFRYTPFLSIAQVSAISAICGQIQFAPCVNFC